MRKLICSMSLALLVLSVVAINATTAAVNNTTPSGGFRPMNSSSFWGNSGGRSLRHARDYSQGFQAYAHGAQTIAPQLAQQEEVGVGQNIAAAQKQFGEVRKATTDKAALASLDVIDQQLAAAVKAHAKMHEMCQMQTIDGTGTMKCCADVDAALAKAIAAHEALMKQIGEAPATPVAGK